VSVLHLGAAVKDNGGGAVIGEAATLAPLRRWVRDDLGLRAGGHDVTGYWKHGVADFAGDDEH
jgi:hypothetical protein